MELSRPPLVVAFELSEKRKAIVADTLAGVSSVVYLTELDEAARAETLRQVGVLLTFNPFKELRSGEAELLDSAQLIQFMIGGVDFIPLGQLPKGCQWQRTAAAMPSRWLSTRWRWHLPPPSA